MCSVCTLASCCHISSQQGIELPASRKRSTFCWWILRPDPHPQLLSTGDSLSAVVLWRCCRIFFESPCSRKPVRSGISKKQRNIQSVSSPLQRLGFKGTFLISRVSWKTYTASIDFYLSILGTLYGCSKSYSRLQKCKQKPARVCETRSWSTKSSIGR